MNWSIIIGGILMIIFMAAGIQHAMKMRDIKNVNKAILKELKNSARVYSEEKRKTEANTNRGVLRTVAIMLGILIAAFMIPALIYDVENILIYLFVGAVVYGVILVIIYFMTRKSNKAYAGETTMYRIKCYVKEVSLSKRGYGGLFLYYDFLQKKYAFKTIVGISSSIKENTFAEFSATEDGNKLKVMELKKPEK